MQSSNNPIKLRGRGLALLLAFGALIVLIIATATTSQAFITTLKHDTLDDFAPGKFHRTGLLDLGTEIESVHLLPIGLVGNWQEEGKLPEPLREFSAVATEDFVVVMGGLNDENQRRDKVWISTIDVAGTIGITGTASWWRAQPALPYQVAGAAAVAVPNPDDQNETWIYLLGGTGGGNAFDDVVYATLNHTTGNLDDWTATTSFTDGVRYLDAITLRFGDTDYIYAIFGESFTPFPEASVIVLYAEVQSDGSLGAWHEDDSFFGVDGDPHGLQVHLAVAYNSEEEGLATIYTVGGLRGTGSGDRTHKVFFTDVYTQSGSPVGWTQVLTGNLGNPIFGHSGLLFRDQIIVTGGFDENNSTQDTVKAALVDPTVDFRLYDWTGSGGASEDAEVWVGGALLPDDRAYHETVGNSKCVYTLGGIEGEFGVDETVTDSIFWGSMDQPGQRYSPKGYYIGPDFDFENPADVYRLEWGTRVTDTLPMSLTMSYRYRRQGENWAGWSAPQISLDGENTWIFAEPITDVRLFEYRVDLYTDVYTKSPRLDWVEVYYEVDDPDVEVIKYSLEMTATVGQPLLFTILYTNTGGWVAEGVVLTETLPEYSVYDGLPEDWHQVGATNQYTHAVGDLNAKTFGSVNFQIKVVDPAPTVFSITNTVEIGFPPMIDALNNTIRDKTPENNIYTYSLPLDLYVIDLIKGAEPPPGAMLTPGSKITYTIYYKNNGRIAANPATLSDVLSPDTNVTVVSATPAPIPGTTNWDLGSLEPGEEGTVELVVQIDDIVYPGAWDLSNKASLSSPQGPVEDSLMVTHTITNYDDNFVIDIVKTAEPPGDTEVESGGKITYSITYKNEGRQPLDPVLVTDTFTPNTNVTVISANPAPIPGTTSWNVGRVEPGAEGTIELVVQIADIQFPAPWELHNVASVDIPQKPPMDSLTVTHFIINHPPYDFEIVKTADPPAGTVIWPGDKVTYTITYENIGDRVADPATVDDIAEPYTEISVVSANPTPTPGTTSWNVGRLEPEDEGSIQLVLEVADRVYPGDATLDNYASLSSPQGVTIDSDMVSHPITNHEYTQFADLVVKNIRWEPSAPQEGSDVKFYVTIGSQGELDAEDEFWVELYIRPASEKPPTMASDHNYGYCLNGTCDRGNFVKSISSLSTGTSFELPAFEGAGMSFAECGNYKIYAQIDVGWDPPGPPKYHPIWGYYIEASEKNNVMVKSLSIPCKSSCPGVCLPLILKRGP